jgi:AcrR family transcriptional regulator
VRQRANLLGAARALLARDDAALTMERLAREAGVSQGLAYRYFPSKDALFRAVLNEWTRQTPPLPQRLDQLPGGPRDRLQFVVERLLERGRANSDFQQFLVRSAHDPRLPRAVRAALRARLDGFREGIRSLIVRAQRAGEIADDDPDELVFALLALLEGIRLRASLVPSGGPPPELPRAEVVLRVLGPPSVPARGEPRPPRDAPANVTNGPGSSKPATRRARTSQPTPQAFQVARHRGPTKRS